MAKVEKAEPLQVERHLLVANSYWPSPPAVSTDFSVGQVLRPLILGPIAPLQYCIFTLCQGSLWRSVPVLLVRGGPQRMSGLMSYKSSGWPAVIRVVVPFGLFSGLLIGCAATWSATQSSNTAGLAGRARGGQQPLVGAHIQLYAVGRTGTASAARPLIATNVTTDSVGYFSLANLYACPSADVPVYLVARGGTVDPSKTQGTENDAIALMTMVGPCGNIAHATTVDLNEVTTVGSIWPLAAYMKSMTQVGAEPNDVGFETAIATIDEMVNIRNGTSPGTPTSESYFDQAANLNSLGDVLTQCVSSEAKTSSGCSSLFAYATPAGGIVPTDTFEAALDIAQHVNQSILPIFNLMSSSLPPFQPALARAPEDWSLKLTNIIPTPIISLPTGIYHGPQQVVLTDGLGGSGICYTVDGTAPTQGSSLYKGPIPVSTTTTIRAIAFSGSGKSGEAASTLTIAPVAARVQFVKQPVNTLMNNVMRPAVTVAVEDEAGNVITAARNQVTVALSSRSGLRGTLTETPENGIATFSNLMVAIPGVEYTMLASSPSLIGSTSTPFTVNAPANVSTSPMLAVPADNFVDSVGLNVHFSYIGSIYVSKTPEMLAAIRQLDVRHLRDQMYSGGSSASGSFFYVTHQTLAAMGVKTDFILTSLSQPLSQVVAFPLLANDMEAVEPANEYDASGDPHWVANIAAQQRQLYAKIKSTAQTSSVKVIAASLAQPENAAALGNIAASADVGNSHAYFGGWNPGNSGTNGANNPAYFMAKSGINVPGKPIWVTETGFWSKQAMYWGGAGDGEALMATYVPRVLLEFWKSGSQRTYLYELADYDSTDSFGLIRTDGTMKPAFYAVANLLTLLSDVKTSFAPGSLSYSLSGVTRNIHQLLMQKANGDFYLALWNESAGMNVGTLADIAIPSQSVTLSLEKLPRGVTSYAWDSTGSMRPSVITPSQTIQLLVGPNILIVQLH
jgi:hypothetical protein